MSEEKPPKPIGMIPTLGRDVHYTEDGHVFAAKIIHVEVPEMTVNLIFWNKYGEQTYRRSVTQADELNTTKCWFWPVLPRPSLEQVRVMGAHFRKEIEESLRAAAKERKNEAPKV